MAKVGVITFLGSLDDRDAMRAVSVVGGDAVSLWHDSTDLQGVDAVLLPGGFSYGDHLRCGALARFSAIMGSVADFAAKGGPVLGICNGFQILCEADLLPGILTPNHGQRFICRDLLLVIGVEPNFRWREFSHAISELATEMGVKLGVTLGGLLADTPHTRAIPVSGAAHDPELIERFDLEPVRYEGPTGIVGVLHDDLAKAGIPSASLWAAVPHYLGGNPNPTAALALVNALEPLVECELSPTELEAASAAFDRQIARVVAKDAEMRSYVTDLENRLDSGDDYEDEDEDDEDDADDDDLTSEADLPSGDEIAAELQEFLREQRDDS